MEQQKHIINKQILEIQLPKTADAFGVQQKVAKLYREQLIPLIDKMLNDRYGGAEKKQIQIDRLTLDLGAVALEEMTAVFEEKFKEELAEVQVSDDMSDGVAEEQVSRPQKTPLRVISHYLGNGILPWWAGDTTKAFLLDQLELLLQASDTTFKKMLVELRFNTLYLQRFLYTFTEEQVLASLQLLTHISIQDLLTVKKELLSEVKKDSHQKVSGFSDLKIETTFWKSAFNQISIANDYEALKKGCIQQTFLELGIPQKGARKKNTNNNLYEIKSLVEKYKMQFLDDTVWQQFFQQVSKTINSPSFYIVNPELLKEFKQALEHLQRTQPKDQEASDTVTRLQPIAQYLQALQTSTRQTEADPESLSIDTLQTPFEDTDFITIQNAGLVLFWPFLQRFFENLEVIKDKTFPHETARHKAICALQYLCNAADTTLFEGALPLNKILCGASLEDAIAPIALSTAEKERAEDLLQAVIQRGPHWTNLSLDGFRTSYLCRQGSLRIRDGHWLLQVQKETYDITLEKLPWSITTVKLPWMNEILTVEWN